jgi:hypothetical protein
MGIGWYLPGLSIPSANLDTNRTANTEVVPARRFWIDARFHIVLRSVASLSDSAIDDSNRANESALSRLFHAVH